MIEILYSLSQFTRALCIGTEPQIPASNIMGWFLPSPFPRAYLLEDSPLISFLIKWGCKSLTSTEIVGKYNKCRRVPAF